MISNSRIQERRNNDERRQESTPNRPKGVEGTAQQGVLTSRPSEKYQLMILSHNVGGAKESKEVDGTPSDMKFEYIALHMEENTINVYLKQERWLEGDTDHWNINNGISFFTHAPEKKSSSRGRGGLAIMLSRKALNAWEIGGKKDIQRHGVMDATTRIMAIDLKVPTAKSFEVLTICNIYTPSTHGNAIKLSKTSGWPWRTKSKGPQKQTPQ
jgi:hypothetical protein